MRDFDHEAAAFLNAHPDCTICAALGFVRPATKVVHREWHHGQSDLFWDHRNWVSLCRRCADAHSRLVSPRMAHFADQALPKSSEVPVIRTADVFRRGDWC